MLAVIATTGTALLAVYTKSVSQYAVWLCSSLLAWSQDHIGPMPADQQIVAQFTFYIPSSLDADHSQEIMGVVLPGKDCRKPGGAQGVKTYDFPGGKNYTDALVKASCRASGKTRVTITPRDGNPLLLYDGFFKTGDQIEFGGVPGSYEHGVLTLRYVGTDEPSGPRVPVNSQTSTNVESQYR